MFPITFVKRASTFRNFLRLLLVAGIAAVTSWAAFTGHSAKLDKSNKESGGPAKVSSLAPEGVTPATRGKIVEEFGQLPLSFEVNRGQTDASVKYVARGIGYNIFLTSAEAIFVVRAADKNSKNASGDDPEAGHAPHSRGIRLQGETGESEQTDKVDPTVLRVRLDGANSNAAAVEGLDQLPGKVNYFHGNDSTKWLTDIETYSKVAYRNAYPGIDLVYYGNRQQLEYDLIVAPGADPGVITFDYDGAENLKVDRDGNLVLNTPAGEVRQLKPVVYQEINGEKKLIDGRYVIRGNDRVGFGVSRYDRSKPLVIDPILVYSSLINAGGFGTAIAVDSNGFAYITGDAFEDLNPTPGAYQALPGGFFDAYVTKINQAGNNVVYTTFVGGNGDEESFGIAVDAAGNALITGYASGTFPTTVGAHQRILGSVFDGFVTKLNATGSGLVYSTLYGGNGFDEGTAIAVDAAGNAYVTGDTRSTNLVTTIGAFQTVNGGGADGFGLRFSPTGVLDYATYLGGGGSEIPLSIAVDSANNIYVAGETSSLNLPQVNSLQGPNGIDRGLFLSTNNGANWTLSQSGLTTSQVSSFAIDPITTAIMYAGTIGGVSKSTNGGVTWVSTAPTNSTVLALAIDPSNTSTVYAGTNNGVYKTTNGGGSWTAINSGLGVFFEPDSPDFIPGIRALAIDPSNPAIVYTGTNVGLFKSTNGGSSWTRISAGLTSSSIRSIVIDLLTPATVYVGTNSSGVFKSNNSGANWTAMNSGLTNLNVRSLAIVPNATATLYAGTLGGIFKTTNGGTSWTAVNTGLLVPFTDNVSRLPSSVNAIVIDAVTPANLYAGSTNSALVSGAYPLTSIHKSTNGGATWTTVTSGFGNLNNGILALAINPGDTSRLFAGNAGDFDGFAAKLNANGTGLIYSTFVGSNRNDFLAGIVPEAAGNSYLFGATAGTNLPVTAGAFRSTLSGPDDTFVMKLNAAGTSRLYSTYLGGSGGEDAFGLAVDSTGNAYVTGLTESTDFPVTPGAFQTTTGNRGGLATTDAFVTKLNPTGTALVYSSYLGGPGEEFFIDFEGGNIALDPLGNAYVVTSTSDFSSFPYFGTANGFSQTFGPSQTAVVKIDGNTASYSITGRLTTAANVPLAGVVVEAKTAQGFSRTATSDNQGYYSIISLPTADYVVTPNRAAASGNYVYTPASRSFPGLSSDQTANFTGTQGFLISGKVTSSTVPGVGIFDVTVTLSGTSSATVTTDANGDYTIFDLLPGNYTVTPTKTGFTFNPTNRVFTGLSADRFDGDFTTASATFFTVNGHIADAANVSTANVQVTMTLLPQRGSRVQSVLTDASGNYSFTNLQAGGNYTFVPTKALFSFTPTSQTFANLSSNQVANFIAGTWQPVVLTAAQIAELKAWTVGGRSYVYVKPQFPDAGFRILDWGQAVKNGNDFTVDASVEKFTGASIKAVVTTAQIYDLGPLANGTYNFNFKTSGTLAKTLQFTISSTVPPPNPIDNAREFVKQQYRDFLNREADQAGEDFWTDNITKCADPARRPAGQTEAQCTLRQRETTSGAFFLSPEFQYTGYFVYRMYQGGLGRQPKLSEFLPDAQFVGNGIIVNGQLSGAKINQNKAAFAAQFVNCTDATKYRCAEFKAIYDGLNNQQYVDTLFQTTGVNASASDRAALVNGLNATPATETRASVLQKVVDGINVIAEGNQQFTTTYGQAFYNQQFNRAFVQLEYFGYMKRDPDDAGYAFWLAKLNQFGGSFVNAEMVLAFISSPEYRARFGQP